MLKVNTSNLRGNDQNEGCYPALACLKVSKSLQNKLKNHYNLQSIIDFNILGIQSHRL